MLVVELLASLLYSFVILLFAEKLLYFYLLSILSIQHVSCNLQLSLLAPKKWIVNSVQLGKRILLDAKSPGADSFDLGSRNLKILILAIIKKQ